MLISSFYSFENFLRFIDAVLCALSVHVYILRAVYYYITCSIIHVLDLSRLDNSLFCIIKTDSSSMIVYFSSYGSHRCKATNVNIYFIFFGLIHVLDLSRLDNSLLYNKYLLFFHDCLF